MVMHILEKQFEFSKMLAELILYINTCGYTVTMGDAYVPEDSYIIHEDGSIKRVHKINSLHYLRLAQDINLFKDGKYLTKTKDHLPFVEYWEEMGGTWGGRFNDGNHYSLEHNGYK